MKLALYLSLLTAFLVPAQLAATVIRLREYVSPNGHTVRILHDVHLSSDLEKQQCDDLIAYLQNKKNTHLAAQDRCALGMSKEHTQSAGSNTVFLQGLVEDAKQHGIDAVSVEFRPGRKEYTDQLGRISVIDRLLKKSASIEHAIPSVLKKFRHKRTYDEAQRLLLWTHDFGYQTFEEVQALVLALAEWSRDCCPSFIFDGARAEQLYYIGLDRTEQLITPATNIEIEILEAAGMIGMLLDAEDQIFDYALLAHVLNDALQQKEIYVCVHDQHAKFLGKALQVLGYQYVSNISMITDENYRHLKDMLYQTVSDTNIDPYALNLKNVLSQIHETV